MLGLLLASLRFWSSFMSNLEIHEILSTMNRSVEYHTELVNYRKVASPEFASAFEETTSQGY